MRGGQKEQPVGRLSGREGRIGRWIDEGVG